MSCYYTIEHRVVDHIVLCSWYIEDDVKNPWGKSSADIGELFIYCLWSYHWWVMREMVVMTYEQAIVVGVISVVSIDHDSMENGWNKKKWHYLFVGGVVNHNRVGEVGVHDGSDWFFDWEMGDDG